jgi:surfactin synthase thioesterase subunit
LALTRTPLVAAVSVFALPIWALAVTLLCVAQTADLRIPIAYTDQMVAMLREAGTAVEMRVIAGDHFVFFERQDAVLEVLTAATSAR